MWGKLSSAVNCGLQVRGPGLVGIGSAFRTTVSDHLLDKYLKNVWERGCFGMAALFINPRICISGHAGSPLPTALLWNGSGNYLGRACRGTARSISTYSLARPVARPK